MTVIRNWAHLRRKQQVRVQPVRIPLFRFQYISLVLSLYFSDGTLKSIENKMADLSKNVLKMSREIRQIASSAEKVISHPLQLI
jgi:hypothetical protein